MIIAGQGIPSEEEEEDPRSAHGGGFSLKVWSFDGCITPKRK